MKKYRQYIWYILRHKYYVFKAGIKLNVPLWQLIIHDWTKFLPDEMIGWQCQGIDNDKFLLIQNLHKTRNPHHWEHWCIIHWGTVIPFMIPEKFAREMVADWCGANMMKRGSMNPKLWYELNKSSIILHSTTHIFVEQLLKDLY